MMNFLDLSAASEEERRRIKEILADTSVVNIAEPADHQNHWQGQAAKSAPTALLSSLSLSSSSNQTTNLTNAPLTSAPTSAPSATSPPSTSTAATPTTTPEAPTPTATTTQSLSSSTNNATTLQHQPDPSVPPQSIANQMPSPMAGDMNSVIGMDMASSRGYAIPAPPPPTHVPAYGPAAAAAAVAAQPPPPPHHVYGGPPIFQPTYAAHYIFPYNLPYPVPYVLPPTNSVVPTRQQVSPQSNHPTSASLNNSSHSRSQLHHPRPNKLKDMQKHQQHNHPLNLHPHHQHQMQHTNHLHQHHQHHQHHHQQQQGYRNNANLEHYVNQGNNVSSQNGDLYIDYAKESNLPNEAPESKEIIQSDKSEGNLKVQTSTNQKEQLENVNSAKITVANEEETVKVSSDEGFETQSSLDLSKQSHESCNALITDSSRPQRENCNNPAINGEKNGLPETNNVEKSQQTRDSKANGPWGSAPSQVRPSWASLFKPDSGTCHTPVEYDPEHNNIKMESENPEEDTKLIGTVNNLENSTINFNSGALSKEQRSQDTARRALDKLAPRLAQKISSISLKHSLPLLRPRGFINKGNGCYINSALQALIACPPFYNLMKEIGDLRSLKRDNSSTPILDSFAELFQHFPPLDASKKNKQSTPLDQKLQMNYLQAEAIEPRCIYNVLGQIKSECLRGAQEDAEEFLSSVLNGLHEEMVGLSESLQSAQNTTSNHNGHLSDLEDLNGDSNNDENLWREVGPRNRSLPIRDSPVINTPIQEIFGGSLFSIRTAGKDRCGHRSPFFDLQLDISGDHVKSLQDAIKSFAATEIIQDFYCSKTKQKLDAQRRTSLELLPPILILHLKQFIYTQDHGLKKLMKKIEFPIDFELPDVCLYEKNSDKSLKNSRSYKLLAVVYHEGKEAVKGHYLTDVYHIGSSQWIRCDDSNLKIVPAPRIENPESSRTPYLLFYRRLNTLGPRQSNSHETKKKN